MLIIYCIGLFDGCFGSGVWQCWNCRVPFFCWDGEGRQREVASVRGAVFFVGMERDATFLWLTLPTDRKKHAGDGSGLGVLS